MAVEAPVFRGGADRDPREGPSPDAPVSGLTPSAEGEQPQVSLRSVTPGDEPFIREVYASTRDAEMALVPWDDETKQRFIDQQFHAQSVHYASNYPDADFDLVLVDEQLAGRLYVQRRGDGIDLLDIALLSAFRNRGVGTRLMLRLVDEAHGAGVPLRLHVERFNPARHLYDRLGFAEIEDRGVYAYMELRPEGSS